MQDLEALPAEQALCVREMVRIDPLRASPLPISNHLLSPLFQPLLPTVPCPGLPSIHPLTSFL